MNIIKKILQKIFGKEQERTFSQLSEEDIVYDLSNIQLEDIKSQKIGTEKESPKEEKQMDAYEAFRKQYDARESSQIKFDEDTSIVFGKNTRVNFSKGSTLTIKDCQIGSNQTMKVNLDKDMGER